MATKAYPSAKSHLRLPPWLQPVKADRTATPTKTIPIAAASTIATSCIKPPASWLRRGGRKPGFGLVLLISWRHISIFAGLVKGFLPSGRSCLPLLSQKRRAGCCRTWCMRSCAGGIIRGARRRRIWAGSGGLSGFTADGIRQQTLANLRRISHPCPSACPP